MAYLLDTSVLIDANQDYYNMDRVPEFWDWLILKAGQEKLKVPIEIYGEITAGRDDLANWMVTNKQVMVSSQNVTPQEVNQLILSGYGISLNTLTSTERKELAKDPYLIAHGKKYKTIGTNVQIVTNEVSKPSKQRANRKIPDVCGNIGISCCNGYEFFRALGFSTDRSRW